MVELVAFSQSQEAINHTTGDLADYLYNDNTSGFAFSARSYAADGHLLQDGFAYLNGDQQSDTYDGSGRITSEGFVHVSGGSFAVNWDYSGTQWYSRFESDYDAGGHLTTQKADIAGGGSLIQTYSQTTDDAWWHKIDWFNGSSGSGAWTKELVDNRDGTSTVIDTGVGKNFAWQISEFSQSNGSGLPDEIITEKLDGSGQTVAYINTSGHPGWATLQYDYDSSHNLVSMSEVMQNGEIFLVNEATISANLDVATLEYAKDYISLNVDYLGDISNLGAQLDISLAGSAAGTAGAYVGMALGGIAALAAGALATALTENPQIGAYVAGALSNPLGAAGAEVGRAVGDYLGDHLGDWAHSM